MKKLKLLGLVGLMMIFSSCGYIYDFSSFLSLNLIWASTSKNEIEKLLNSPSEIILENEKYSFQIYYCKGYRYKRPEEIYFVLDNAGGTLFPLLPLPILGEGGNQKFFSKFKPDFLWIINKNNKVFLKIKDFEFNFDKASNSYSIHIEDTSNLYENYFYKYNEKTDKNEYVTDNVAILHLNSSSSSIYIKSIGTKIFSN